MPTFITRSPEETIALAKKAGALLQGGEVLAYRGGMGAGKTTFTRGLALGMGLPDLVTSPTFALVNEYRGKGGLSLCHFDLYRIQGRDGLETTGFYDYMEPDTVLAVEWSENAAEFLPPDAILITFVSLNEQEREITIEGDGRFEALGD